VKTIEIPVERLRELFTYNSDTGVLRRRINRGARFKAGEIVGCNVGGYLKVQIQGRKFRLHRVIWALHTGRWPLDVVDHINGDTTDNRICNLRDVPSKTNSRNRLTAHKQNSLGILGVHVNGSSFCAAICVDGQQIHLGSFKTAEQASAAYRQAKRELHKDANHV
jgi:hypothetical protein